MSSNSVDVIAKAMIPGETRRGIVFRVKSGWWRSWAGDSKRRWEIRREKNIMGARCKRVLKGLRVAFVWCNNNWVRDQRRPDSAEAVMTSRKLW